MSALVFSAVLTLLLFSITPYLPWSVLAADLPSHFVFQYLIGAGVLFVLALGFAREPAVFAMLGVAFCLNLWQMKDMLPKHPPAAAGAIKILQSNVFVLNKKPDKFLDLLRAEKPDIVVAAEVNSEFAAAFREMRAEYPHQSVLPMDHASYGLAILSKLPLESVETTHFDIPAIPALAFDVLLGNKKIHMVSVHPSTPNADIESRDREFAALAKHILAKNAEHSVVLGDFNATPFCPAFKKLAAETGLAHARAGFGYLSSWPAWLPAFMRLPIDHLLASRSLSVIEYRTGPMIGSDHLPMIAVLGTSR